MIREGAVDDLKARIRKVQVVFSGEGPPPGFRVPGAIRQQAEGVVVTALVDTADKRELDSLRSTPGVRITEFAVSLEDLFIELMDRNGDAGNRAQQEAGRHEQ
jgi:hypothetical protein